MSDIHIFVYFCNVGNFGVKIDHVEAYCICSILEQARAGLDIVFECYVHDPSMLVRMPSCLSRRRSWSPTTKPAMLSWVL